MTTATAWGAATELAQCHRCGKTGRVPAGSRAHGRLIFCTTQCREWHEEDVHIRKLNNQAARNFERTWARREAMRNTPMHELHPGMLEVMALVQSWRPSYCAWIGCLEEDAIHRVLGGKQ